MSRNIGVIGAGSGAAAATYVLGPALPDAAITVFEKSRGVCGRAAARRREDLVYEYGANYLSDDGGRVRALVTGPLNDGLVAVDGPVWTFDEDGSIDEPPTDAAQRWTYEDGITRLAKHLFGEAGVTVTTETRVTDVVHDDGWHLTATDGTRYGPFDALLVNPPAPQAADLLTDTGVPAVDRLGAAADAVSYQSGWTAVLGYDGALDVPYYGLANRDGAHTIRWIGREECKPGHVPGDRSVLIVQAHPDWAAERYDAPPADNVAHLARAAAGIVGNDRLAHPDWTDHQGWKYAFASATAPTDALQAAAEAGVYATGDWVADAARLDATLREGLDTGNSMVQALD